MNVVSILLNLLVKSFSNYFSSQDSRVTQKVRPRITHVINFISANQLHVSPANKNAELPDRRYWARATLHCWMAPLFFRDTVLRSIQSILMNIRVVRLRKQISQKFLTMLFFSSCICFLFYSISEPFLEIWKTRFILIWHCREQRKIRCLGRDSNSHLRVSRPPLYQLSYRVNWDW